MKKFLTLALVLVSVLTFAPKKADAGIGLIVGCATTPAWGCTPLIYYGIAVGTPFAAGLGGFIFLASSVDAGISEDGLVPFIIGAALVVALDEEPTTAIQIMQGEFPYLDGTQAQALYLVTQKKASSEVMKHEAVVGQKSFVGIELDDKDLETILGKSFLQSEEGQQVLSNLKQDLSHT